MAISSILGLIGLGCLNSFEMIYKQCNNIDSETGSGMPSYFPNIQTKYEYSQILSVFEESSLFVAPIQTPICDWTIRLWAIANSKWWIWTSRMHKSREAAKFRIPSWNVERKMVCILKTKFMQIHQFNQRTLQWYLHVQIKYFQTIPSRCWNILVDRLPVPHYFCVVVVFQRENIIFISGDASLVNSLSS